MVFPYKRRKSGLKKEEAVSAASFFLQIQPGRQTKTWPGDAAGKQKCRQLRLAKKNTQKFASMKKSGILKSERNKKHRYL